MAYASTVLFNVLNVFLRYYATFLLTVTNIILYTKKLINIEGGRTNCSITLFVDICNYLNVTPDYLMLGNMRGNRASIDIIDELKMCSSEEIATVKKIVDAFVLKKTEPY